ncbi:hypothetical protein SAMN05444680_11856 [Variovorax sp. YR216]|nr:hypothetical protein SAMN05444680_11856 [Variovorax sp. YR216]
MHAMKQIEASLLVEHARRIVALTGAAWKVPPLSAHAVARRAPHGYVPARIARRIGSAIGANPEVVQRAPLAYAW